MLADGESFIFFILSSTHHPFPIFKVPGRLPDSNTPGRSIHERSNSFGGVTSDVAILRGKKMLENHTHMQLNLFAVLVLSIPKALQ